MNEGFFNAHETLGTSRRSRYQGCGRCRLNRTCRTPNMPPTGEGRREVLIIAEAPGELEDARGVQLIGPAGQVLRKVLTEIGVDLDRDCRKTNAVTCRPPDNRTPTEEEIEGCRPQLWKELEERPPKLVIPLGNAALEALWGHRFPEALGGIMRWRGFRVPDRETRAWVCPVFHPSYVMRQGPGDVSVVIWARDLVAAFQTLQTPFPTFRPELECVEILTGLEAARAFLRDLLRSPPPVAAFDYETTGLKPQAEGHRIVTMSIAPGPDRAVAFPMFPELRPEVVAFLQSPIRKVASNFKFEEVWSRVQLGTRVHRWYWDTMLAAHTLDNRPEITSIKFQAALRYGLMDYASHISPFLESGKRGANELNRIHLAPLNELLVYNAVDSLVEYRVARDQAAEMRSL